MVSRGGCDGSVKSLATMQWHAVSGTPAVPERVAVFMLVSGIAVRIDASVPAGIATGLHRCAAPI